MLAFRPAELTPQQNMQAMLHTLATMALEASTAVDARGDVWHTKQGRALVHAAYDVFEKDELYDFAQDLEREFAGPDLIGDTVSTIWGARRG